MRQFSTIKRRDGTETMMMYVGSKMFDEINTMFSDIHLRGLFKRSVESVNWNENKKYFNVKEEAQRGGYPGHRKKKRLF